jgi:putative ABC transport system permease protein
VSSPADTRLRRDVAVIRLIRAAGEGGLHDLRHACRHLAATPGLTAVIVVSLALGTGANAAVYSAIDALLFRPPAGVADPATLADIFTSQVNGGTYGLSSYADFASIASAPGFAGVAAIDDRADQAVRAGDKAAAPRVAAVTPNYWELLRLQPFAGSWSAGGAVLSYDAWQMLGADPALVGRTVNVEGRDYRLAAIAPRGFRGLHLDRVFDAWIPLAADAAAGGRGDRHLRVIGRLASADIDHVQSALSALSLSLARAYPDTNLGTLRTTDEPRRFTVLRYSRLDPAIRWRTAMLAAALLGATALMLLSACVNAGSLLLSRGIARRTELTIKVALGADRTRLVRQILLESVLLSGAGALAGIVAAVWSAGAIPALFAPDHARLLDTRVDLRVMAIGLGGGVLTGLLCGLGPALVSTRALAVDALRGDAARIGERQGGARLRMILVGAQLALSTVFLIGSALLTTVVDTALGSQRSRAAGEVTVASIESYDDEYRAAADAELRRTPGVDVVGWVTTAPLARAVRRSYLISRGPAVEPVDVDINFASPDYFRALHLPVIEGRTFTATDGVERDDVAIVNEALEQRYFAGIAVGRSLTAADGRTVEIVGVVRTRGYRAFEGPPAPMVYYPIARSRARAYSAVVRSQDYSRADGRVRAALERAGPPNTLVVMSFGALLARALAADRLVARLAGACGLASLALAIIGVYGVIADLVRRRTREIGLRIALGASPWQVLHAVLGFGLTPALAGVTAGVLGAEAAVRLARSFVFELPVLDATLVLLTTGGLAAIVAAAVIPHALRAVRISPVVVLRN